MRPDSSPVTGKPFLVAKTRRRWFGLTLDQTIKAFFGGNAFTAVVVLALISLFLVREGADFFGQNRESITIYRKAGLEFVDIMRQQLDDHTALTRYLFDIRMRAVRHLTEEENLSVPDANARLVSFDDFAGRFSDAVEPIRGLVSELTDVAVEIKTKFRINEDAKLERQQYRDARMTDEADAVVINDIDFKTELAPLIGVAPAYIEAAGGVSVQLAKVISVPPPMPTPELRSRLQRFQALTHEYLGTFPETRRKIESWDFDKPVPFWDNVTGFIFGRQWITASFWQDWYGVLPLFVGSIMVSIIALVLAVPLGVGGAIYINQFATQREQRLVKPAIEFISAIPSVVLGFFGIAVLGQALRALSQVAWLSWVPGFPFAERLNALTAGCLLALVAVPTIFTLAEDALNNVPRSFQGSVTRFGRLSHADHHAHCGASFALRNRFGSVARTWPRHRRDDGRPSLRG